jgi:hypothetical protein
MESRDAKRPKDQKKERKHDNKAMQPPEGSNNHPRPRALPNHQRTPKQLPSIRFAFRFPIAVLATKCIIQGFPGTQQFSNRRENRIRSFFSGFREMGEETDAADDDGDDDDERVHNHQRPADKRFFGFVFFRRLRRFRPVLLATSERTRTSPQTTVDKFRSTVSRTLVFGIDATTRCSPSIAAWHREAKNRTKSQEP